MTGMFCAANATSNEEYKSILKKRIVIYAVLAIIGAATAVIALIFGNDDYTSGFFSGVGTGICVASVIFIVRSVLLLKNEAKLKADRLKNCDERNCAISFKASRAAALGIFVVAYCAAFVFAAYNSLVATVLICVIVAYVLLYAIFWRIYSSKM